MAYDHEINPPRLASKASPPQCHIARGTRKPADKTNASTNDKTATSLRLGTKQRSPGVSPTLAQRKSHTPKPPTMFSQTSTRDLTVKRNRRRSKSSPAPVLTNGNALPPLRGPKPVSHSPVDLKGFGRSQTEQPSTSARAKPNRISSGDLRSRSLLDLSKTASRQRTLKSALAPVRRRRPLSLSDAPGDELRSRSLMDLSCAGSRSPRAVSFDDLTSIQFDAAAPPCSLKAGKSSMEALPRTSQDRKPVRGNSNLFVRQGSLSPHLVQPTSVALQEFSDDTKTLLHATRSHESLVDCGLPSRTRSTRDMDEEEEDDELFLVNPADRVMNKCSAWEEARDQLRKSKPLSQTFHLQQNNPSAQAPTL